MYIIYKVNHFYGLDSNMFQLQDDMLGRTMDISIEDYQSL